MGNVGFHANELDFICRKHEKPGQKQSKWRLMERITHLHDDPSLRLARPDIVQAHRPVVPNARQHARLRLVEFDLRDRLQRV